MIALGELRRLLTIQRVVIKYGLDDLVVGIVPKPLQLALYALPDRWLHKSTRSLPRGERLRRALEELGPIFIKFGQALSTRQDLLPADIAAELTRLQDDVPPFDSRAAQTHIEQALGAPVEELFTRFDREPLASASIAQVHAACLPGGQEVVVKVLRPGMQPIIRRDIALMYHLARLAERYWVDGRRLRAVAVVGEFEKTIVDEMDLVREGANAAQLRRNFEGSASLYIPVIHWEYTRENVLVIERICGVPVSDIDRLNALNVNMKALAERGVEVFFTQVFRDNFFHADMHPGNVFVDPENPHDPRYIAVDFGIVGSLTDQDRRYLAENLVAFFRRDYRRVAELHVNSGWVPSSTRVEEFEAAIRTVCEPVFEKPLAEISFAQVLIRLFATARRFNMEVQPQLVLLEKTLFNIEGLGRQLYPQLDLWKTAKPFLERWMADQVGPKAAMLHVKRELPRWSEILPSLPGLLHDGLRQMSDQQQRHDEQMALMNASLKAQRSHTRRMLASIAGFSLVLIAVALHWSHLQQGGEIGVSTVALGITGLLITVTSWLRSA